MLNGIDQLKHKLADVLGLQRAFVKADGFIEVTIGAKLEDKVDVVLGLEGLKQVDNVGVRANAEVDSELLGALVHGQSGLIGASVVLGDDLDRNDFASYEVLGLEDHAEGAMIEWGDGFIPPIKYNALMKQVAHALHK